MSSTDCSTSVRKSVPLFAHSSYEIGGIADFFCTPDDQNSVENTLCFAREHSLRLASFGYGTNTLFSDHPAPDRLYMSLKRMTEIREVKGGVFLGAGVPLAFLPILGSVIGRPDLRFAHLLPGSLGAGVYMNAHCYEGEVGSVVGRIYYLDLDHPDGVRTIPASDAGFAYKASVFQTHRYLVLGAEIACEALSADAAKLIRTFSETLRNDSDGLSGLSAFQSKVETWWDMLEAAMPSGMPVECMKIENDRLSKKHFSYPSCGSVFKNNHDFGRPTGALVDELGMKGKSRGKAMISPYHGNFIINTGGATAEDVLGLIRDVQDAVEKKYGFIPEPEVVILD